MSRATWRRRSPRWGCRSRSRRAPATRRLSRRQRQRRKPPDILLTTPEQLALLLSSATRAVLFRGRCSRSCSTSCMRWSPPSAAICCRSAWPGCSSSRRNMRRDRAVGHGRRSGIAGAGFWLPQPTAQRGRRHRASARRRAAPVVDMLRLERQAALGRPHRAPRAWPEVYEADQARQAPRWSSSTPAARPSSLFQELWRMNEDNLPIALHHGSLAAEQRRKVEAAMARGRAARRGLHLDARSRHRLGRRRPGHPARRAQGRLAAGAAHRPRQSPARRAQRARCWCRPTASRCWNARPRARRSPRTRWTPSRERDGALDVLAQHVLGLACAEPFDPIALYDEVRTAAPYRDLTRDGFRRTWSISSPPAAMR